MIWKNETMSWLLWTFPTCKLAEYGRMGKSSKFGNLLDGHLRIMNICLVVKDKVLMIDLSGQMAKSNHVAERFFPNSMYRDYKAVQVKLQKLIKEVSKKMKAIRCSDARSVRIGKSYNHTKRDMSSGCWAPTLSIAGYYLEIVLNQWLIFC